MSENSRKQKNKQTVVITDITILYFGISQRNLKYSFF